MSNFTHLNVASSYSGHYGVTSPQALAVAAKSLGFDALAITDRDGLYGAIKHIDACLQLNLDPIVGVNLMVTDEVGAELGRCIILAHGQNHGAGWRALCKLISVAHTKKEPSITRAEPF
jgi:error-prone DNA polymerase